jgi:Spy/CpxP family protein refolding chaperone
MFSAVLIAMSVPVWADDADDFTGGYGYGMGPGMMGGYGHGHMGMMGTGALGMLDLTDEQRTKIEKIHVEERKQHLAVMGKMLDVQSKMRELYAADEPDPKKVGMVYGEMTKLQQQMLETHVQASNQMQALLTKEQREQFKQWHRGGWGSRCDKRGMPGSGNMPGGMMGR